MFMYLKKKVKYVFIISRNFMFKKTNLKKMRFFFYFYYMFEFAKSCATYMLEAPNQLSITSLMTKYNNFLIVYTYFAHIGIRIRVS